MSWYAIFSERPKVIRKAIKDYEMEKGFEDG